MTSIRTSCTTRTLRPTRVSPLISKLNTAWSFFFASFITTSSVSYRAEDDAVDPGAEAEVEADLSAERSASEERLSVIVFAELDWMR
jgi:hypothetical protein